MDDVHIHACDVDVDVLEDRIRSAAPGVTVTTECMVPVFAAAPRWVMATVGMLDNALGQLIVDLIVEWAREARIRTKIMDDDGKTIAEVNKPED